MTQTYYGTKRIEAWPEERSIDQAPGYGIRYPDGYTSWSPKHVFEAAYEPHDAMGFEGALCALKEGRRVTRTGWNGVGMWVCLGAGHQQAADGFWNRHTRAFAERQPDQTAFVLPYLILRSERGIQMGWSPEQADVLAGDWRVVPEEQL